MRAEDLTPVIVSSDHLREGDLMSSAMDMQRPPRVAGLMTCRRGCRDQAAAVGDREPAGGAAHLQPSLWAGGNPAEGEPGHCRPAAGELVIRQS